MVATAVTGVPAAVGTATIGPALKSVLDLVAERFHEDLTVADLADEAGYSPFHFSRLFVAAMRVPPARYLAAVRMDAAKRMLLTGDDAVIDVATAVGFDSLSSFSRRFRTSVGVPPGALRHLADKLADHPARPFQLGDARQATVRITPVLPAALGDTAHLWLGWYPQPAPVGLPRGGVLAEFGDPVDLPLAPGAPWLLGFAVPKGLDVTEQLAPTRPVVAVHHGPITEAGSVRLVFAAAGADSVPLLTALPSLCRKVG